MVQHQDRVQARIDTNLKASAEAVFSRLGISSTEAIRMFYAQVSLRNGIPFEVSIPNKETIKAMKEIKEGKGQHCSSVENLFKELDD